MTTIAATRISFPHSSPIAPWWHTALLVALFLWLAVSGALFQKQAQEEPGLLQHRQVVPVYLSIMAIQWVLFVAVWKGGLARTGASVRELIGGRWASAKEVLIDCGLAVALWVLWAAFRMMWIRWLGQGHAASIQTLLPQGPLETMLWIGVSITAGFCEEIVFRGYFHRQFEILTQSRWMALALQALLFGISHGYQGIEACLKITLVGALFGLCAIWRRSLRPGIVAHAWSDILGGIFGV